VTPVIRLQDIGKRYVKYDDAPMLATAMLRLRTQTRRSRLWAVRHFDLEVNASECVGIIGRNGSGKSTLLQVVSGITAPTEGRARIQGRIAPLIAVGVGFHPELSGRDNIYLNGTILGMTRAEIDRRYDEIVAFSEIESFIDTPLKFYSSGMAVRLGFSVAVQAEPKVLIVDEVLAVGDFAFQMKCFERIQQIRDNGSTILVVSHNLSAVRQICDRAVLMHAGTKQFEGDVGEAISRFHTLLDEDRELEGDSPGKRSTFPLVAGYAEEIETTLLDADGQPARYFEVGERVVVRSTVRALRDIESPSLNLIVESNAGILIYQQSNWASPFPRIPQGEEATLEASFVAQLTKGDYNVQSAVVHAIDGQPVRLVDDSQLTFYVAGRSGVRGVADLSGAFHGVSQR
jgi:ABC-type polysaccharide/polyol phosphate transport system ATPase subunit